MFRTAFEGDLTNAKQGRRYRSTLLEKGGSQDEMKTLTQFLSRAPETEAFYEDLGLS
jgi:metallopeptidase MepB